MERDEFDNLTVLEQVNYINSVLSKGDTLTKVCKYIGIGRTTIRDRFEKIGYKYDSSSKIYKSIIDIVENDSFDIKKTQESSNKVVMSETPDNSNETKKDIPGGNYNIKLLNMINDYEENLNKLNKVYEWFINSSNNENILNLHKLEIGDFEGELVSRSFKLYTPIQEEFTNFCKKNSKYKVQDIHSQALREFMDKYNR